MKPQKHKSIKLGIFPLWVDLYIGGTLDQARQKFIKGDKTSYLTNLEWTQEGLNPCGKTVMNTSSNIIFMWLKESNVSVLAHEAVHVAFFAHEILGGLFTHEMHETCAYIVEHIVHEGTIRVGK